MEHFIAFWVLALTAFAAENAIFARGLGLNRHLLFLKSPRQGILYGSLLTWMLVISSLLVGLANLLLPQAPYTPFLRAPVFFVCVTLVYLATYWLSRKCYPRLHIRIRSALPISTFNSALFGALFVPTLQEFDIFQTLGYSLGAGAGYTAALLVIYYARKRLAISPVPRAFRGLPILLVYIGLLSLAIYGLIGHMLQV